MNKPEKTGKKSKTTSEPGDDYWLRALQTDDADGPISLESLKEGLGIDNEHVAKFLMPAPK